MDSPAAPRPPHRAVTAALALALAAVAPALVSAWLHPRAPAWHRVAEAGTLSWTEARALHNALWIDARSAEDFARGHVDTALSLPASAWDAHVEAVLREWSPGRPVVVYCDGDGCRASHAVAQRLRDELGLSDIHVLAGGWHGEPAPTP